MFARRSVLALLAALPALLAGCSGESSSAEEPVDEGALRRGGQKTITTGITNPGGLFVTSKNVYFSSNKFIASGEPELDQAFAHWEGTFSRKSLEGGRREKITEMPVGHVRQSGDLIFYKTADSCWIARREDSAAASAEGITIDGDERCDGEGSGVPAGFEVTDNKLIIIREGGEVMVGSLEGANMRKVAEFRFGDYGGFIRGTALADAKVFALTAHGYPDHANNRQILPQRILSVAVSGGTPKVAAEFAAGQPQVQNLTSDGKNIYFTQDNKVFALKGGSGEPKRIGEGFQYVSELASDGKTVYVADGKGNALYAIKNALTEPEKVKLAEVKGIQTIAAGNGKVYFASHARDGRKAAGIVGSIDIAQE